MGCLKIVWDVLSGLAEMAWDVLSGVAKMAWDVLSGAGVSLTFLESGYQGKVGR